jgi:hypothetical protein
MGKEHIAITVTDISKTDEGFVIMAWDAQGREYILLSADSGFVTFQSPLDARRLVEKIKAKGLIDPAYWTCRAPYGSLAWDIDGEEERQIEDERNGW